MQATRGVMGLLTCWMPPVKYQVRFRTKNVLLIYR